MDGLQFDAWTRRRFGLAASGVVASIFGLAASEGTESKKRHKRRCRKLGQACMDAGGRRKRHRRRRKCCKGLRCERHPDDAGAKPRCCRAAGDPCESSGDCCNLCCDPTGVCSDACASDRALKANFASVDGTDLLRRVRDLPISSWNYTRDDPNVRHIGPMAQDFAALFGVGADDRHILPIDGQGVALAAIQGLADLVAALQEENVRLAARVGSLERGGQRDRESPCFDLPGGVNCAP